MQPITPAQLQKLNIMLSQMKIQGEDKKALVWHNTNGRVESTKELYKDEARDLITELAKTNPLEIQRKTLIRAIWKVAFDAGVIYGNSYEDMKMNAAKINSFLLSKGTVKKELQKMNVDQLKQTHRQFEGILSNNKKNSDNKDAKAATHNLLKELNIPLVK